MRRQAQVAPKSEYFKPQNGAMKKGDFEQAKIYAERAKQKYLQKKSKKIAMTCQTLKSISRCFREAVIATIIIP